MVYFSWAGPPSKVRFGLRPKRTVWGGNGSKVSRGPIEWAGPSLNAEDKYPWNFSQGQGRLIEGQNKLKNLNFLRISRIFDQS